jgi:hypothetical protein
MIAIKADTQRAPPCLLLRLQSLLLLGWATRCCLVVAVRPVTLASCRQCRLSLCQLLLQPEVVGVGRNVCERHTWVRGTGAGTLPGDSLAISAATWSSSALVLSSLSLVASKSRLACCNVASAGRSS